MFDYTREQLELRKTAMQFSESLNPFYGRANEFDADIFLDLWKRCSAFGITGLPVPEEYGGLNNTLPDILAIMDGLGYGSDEVGVMFAVSAHIWACELPLLHFGNAEQKSRYLARMACGELIGAHCLTEPEAGSGISGMKTVYRKDNNQYLLNGEKTFITSAPVAGLFIVYAKPANGETRGRGISCFLVEKGTEGLQIGRNENKMGLHWSPMAGVAFTDCRVPEENMLGYEFQGMNLFNLSMEYERPFLFAFQTGIMERILEKCLAYAKQRKQEGIKIIRHQAVAHMLAEMKVNIEAAKLLIRKAAHNIMIGRSSVLDSSIAKLFISEHFVTNAIKAMEVFGAYGYMKEYKIEGFLRDIIAGKFYSGTSQIQKNIIAAML